MSRTSIHKCGFYLICTTLSLSVLGQSSPLPDPRLTPGSIDPSVTQENIHTTVCIKGYTDSVRPDKEYTNRLKHEQLRQYRYPDLNPRNYEQDHLIPLNIGGNPSDPKNLWSQPRQPDRRDLCRNHQAISMAAALSPEPMPRHAMRSPATSWS